MRRTDQLRVRRQCRVFRGHADVRLLPVIRRTLSGRWLCHRVRELDVQYRGRDMSTKERDLRPGLRGTVHQRNSMPDRFVRELHVQRNVHPMSRSRLQLREWQLRHLYRAWWGLLPHHPVLWEWHLRSRRNEQQLFQGLSCRPPTACASSCASSRPGSSSCPCSCARAGPECRRGRRGG